jgi:hypothetical protein
MLIGACGVGALAWYVKGNPDAAHVPADLRRETPAEARVDLERPQPAKSEAEEKAPAQEQTVLVPVIEDDKLASDMKEATVPDGKDAKVYIVEQIAKSDGVEAHVLGVDVHNGVAVVNFAKGIDDGMGSDQEALFITALQKAFAQFPEVQKLELDSENHPLDSLGGHIDLTEGLPVTRTDSKPSPQ